jgi:predicted dehydrogenase
MKRFAKARDIRSAVIGYGPSFDMGKFHFEQMRKAGMTPVAVADINPARLAAAARDFPGVETYPSVAELLRKADVDLVEISTEHNVHAKLALQCLRAGKHVIVEKPMAVTAADCDRMIAQARASGVMLTVHHNRHWDGCIVHALKALRSGAIGQVVRVQARMGGCGKPGDWWRASKSISGGVLYDWGVHHVEYCLQIIDSELTEVSGYDHRGFWSDQTRWKADTNEDEAFAVARFASGAWLTLCITHVDPSPKWGWVEITGTRGAYVFDGDRWETTRRADDQTVVTKGRNPPSDWLKFYRNVAAHLIRGAELVITPEWARRPIHIIDLAGQSAAAGRAMKARYA